MLTFFRLVIIYVLFLIRSPYGLALEKGLGRSALNNPQHLLSESTLLTLHNVKIVAVDKWLVCLLSDQLRNLFVGIVYFAKSDLLTRL